MSGYSPYLLENDTRISHPIHGRIGPYYSYLAGTGHPADAPAIPWEQVPECVTTIRNKMQDVVMHEGGLKSFQVKQMTILGWHAAGSRKVSKFTYLHDGIYIVDHYSCDKYSFM